MSEGAEKDIRLFFRKIVRTITATVVWMLTAAWLGFYKKLAIVEGDFTWQNGVYYFIVVVGFIFLIRFYIKQWSRII